MTPTFLGRIGPWLAAALARPGAVNALSAVANPPPCPSTCDAASCPALLGADASGTPPPCAAASAAPESAAVPSPDTPGRGGAWHGAVFLLAFVAALALPCPVGRAASPTATARLAHPLAGAASLAAAALFAAHLTERRRDAAARREAEILHRLADAAAEGMMIHDNGVILHVNQALAGLLGLPAGWLIGHDISVMSAPCSQPLICQRRRMPERLLAPHDHRAEITLLGAGGRTVPAEIVSHPIEFRGRPAVLVTLRDLSESKAAIARIEYLARHDPLTGLPNRSLFTGRLNEALATLPPGGRLALLQFNVDRFKAFNELYGPGVADALLAGLGERLRGAVRGRDCVARLGGDEFGVMLDLPEPAAHPDEIARRLAARLAEKLPVEGRMVEPSLSIGLALYPADAGCADELVLAATAALRRATEDGGNRVCCFDRALDAPRQAGRVSLVALEQDLRHAIARNELSLAYQPIFDCAGGAIEGFEALLRWTHPERGPVSPAVFIPAAEHAGLIEGIGEWVLRTACAEAVTWPDSCNIAINLSPLQFRNPCLPALIAAILKETGLNPERLDLEVTEGVLIEDADRALAMLQAMRAQGVRLSLDDFGSGYSSLSYLSRFPFDTLKIDRSFVQAVNDGPEAAAIVRAMIGLGQTLRRQVVAEGVETEAQREHLRRYNCDKVQGFLLGRPMTGAAAARLLAGAAS
ncbi:MAG TPA: EAL domain-containing protein [Acetobacteraceae bacterium]|nr:EAL domain-containing protein [Acetobacteraceae bacterium]